MDRENFEPRTFMMSDRTVSIISTVATDRDIRAASALDLIIQEWLDYERGKVAKKISIARNLRRIIETQKEAMRLIDKIQEEVNSD
ncbi:hypothetical protein [Pleurocapsa sp. FMAR1]|uniref:hypothetical protein n=1 Tax=Pleurocapsa sp. FMAR1 TaxID=3040204 RepID=UPI0029C99A68|nr:hypothetical protein [Pleurocapsa sp. FMAR1]